MFKHFKQRSITKNGIYKGCSVDYQLLGILLTVIIQGLCIAYKMGKFEEKLTALEAKQDKHNNVIERTYKNERDISVMKEQIKVENHRIDDLERG